MTICLIKQTKAVYAIAVEADSQTGAETSVGVNVAV